MAIVASIIVEDRTQKDGRRAVRERHTDHMGSVHFYDYLANAATNVTTTMNARVASIETHLRDMEISLNMAKAYAGQIDFTTAHSTDAQNAAQLREEFKSATGFRLTVLGYSLESYRQSPGLTDNRMKALFGINDAQLLALKTKLTAMHGRYLAVTGDTGQ